MTGARRGGLLLALCAACTAAHIRVNAQGLGCAGPWLVLDCGFDLLLACASMALFAGVGEFVLARFGLFFERPIERIVFSAAVGAGILAACILICGLFFGLNAPILAGLLLAFAWLSRAQLRGLPAAARGVFSSLRTQGTRLSAVLSACAAFFMLVQALAPPLDWDSLMYHLRVPAQFLQEGRFFLPEDNLRSAYVLLAHMLYLPPLSFGSLAGPALLSASFALLLGLAVFAFCLRFLDAAVAAVALPLLWGSAILALVAVTPRVDAFLSFDLFLAHYALLLALSDADKKPFFFLSALLLGMAAGVKYSALMYLAALSPLILWTACARFQGFPARARALAGYGLLVLAAALPWLLKNRLFHGASLYPFFTAEVMDPWLALLRGSRGVNIHASSLEGLRQITAPFNIPDLIAAPGRLSIEDEASSYLLNPLLALLPFSLFFWRDSTLRWLIIPPMLYAAAVAAYLPANHLRYLIPALAPLSAAAAVVLARTAARFLPHRKGAWLCAGLVALASAPAFANLGQWLHKSLALEHLIGTASKEEVLLNAQVPVGSREYARVVSYVNRSIPPQSRVLMIAEARGFYFNVPVIEDGDLANWPLLSRTRAAKDCLRGTGISHVLVNNGALDYYVGRGLSPGLLERPAFGEFSRKCLTMIRQEDGYDLYRARTRTEMTGSMRARGAVDPRGSRIGERDRH